MDNRTIVVIAASLAVALGIMGLLYMMVFVVARLRFGRRLERLGADDVIVQEGPSDWRNFSTGLDRTGWGKKTTERLRLADLQISPTIFLLSRVVVTLLVFGAIHLLLGVNPVVNAVISFVSGSLILRSYLRSRQDAYISAFDAQMPEVTLLMGNSLRAGLSVLQCVEVVAERMPRPAGDEFGRLAREIRLGKSMEDAMVDMLGRLPSGELRMMVTTILIQRVAGGNLAHALSVMSEAVSARFKLRDEVKTMTAEARYSGMVLLVVPVAVLGILNQLMEGAVGEFLSGPIGWVIGGLVVGIMALAFMLIGRVATVEV